MQHIFNDFGNAFPKFSLLNGLISNPTTTLLTIVPAVSVIPVVDFWSAVFILAILFVADLITGILASYFVWKDNPNKKDSWFFGKGEGFSSDKFKKMFIKLIIYLGTPLVLEQFQKVFRIRNFKYETLSDAEFSIATLLIIIFCLNEGFSIFHENLPKCGFNLWKQIKRMIGAYKELQNDITNDNQNTE